MAGTEANSINAATTGIVGNTGTSFTGSPVTQYDVIVGGSTSSTLSSVGPGTALQVLQSGGASANPAYSTATYPATTTVNQILYSSSSNVVAGLATADNGLLITSAAGVPSILADGTTGQVLTATTGSPPSWANPATSGTVTSVSVVSTNGFAGTVANATTTPAITMETTQTGLLSGNGTAITGTAITQYNVLTAGASNAPNSVAPSATSGVPLISQGSSSQPAFGTAVVAGGGTGDTSFTAYSVICGGTTSTAALQNVSGVGTANQVLTSNGASALPTWQSVSALAFQVTRQVFTSSGTYTPTSGMAYCDIEVVGGGGGGGAAPTTTTGSTGAGGGGGGGYARGIFSATTIGSSQTVTIGAAGSAGVANSTGAGTGGTTSVGSLISATGGVGGSAGINDAAIGIAGGAGGAGSNGDFQTHGTPGGAGFGAVVSFGGYISGSGGSSYFGGGAPAIAGINAATVGTAATSYGGGGSGGGCSGSNSGANGGAGAKGVVIVTEYIT